VGLQLVSSKKPAATEREFEWKGVLILLSLLLLLGYSWWKNSDSKNYPFNENSLPLGTSDFIEAMKIKGKYALAPSYAGYIEWRLSPDIQIHSDMQFPPFHELDFFEIHKSMLSKPAHQHFVEKYKPDLIGVRKTFDKFPTLLGKNSPYVPIFFDHLMILYINGVKYPRIKENTCSSTSIPTSRTV